MSKIIIYTDGACTGNPGHGGYGVVMKKGEKRKEFSDGYRFTTNNRMEMLAVIVALQNVNDKSADIELYTDSQLIVNAVEKDWLGGWKRRGWKKADKTRVLNQDLWLRIDGLLNTMRVRFNWVKGHAGIEENERCDELATEMADLAPFKIDSVYESENRPSPRILRSYEEKLSENPIKPTHTEDVQALDIAKQPFSTSSGSNSSEELGSKAPGNLFENEGHSADEASRDQLKIGRSTYEIEMRADGKCVIKAGSKSLPVMKQSDLSKLGKWIIEQSKI